MNFILTACFQDEENYGDEARPYWKFKGGPTVELCTVSLEEATRGQLYLQSLVELYVQQRGLSENNDMFRRNMIDWELLPEGDFMIVDTDQEIDRLCYSNSAEFQYDGWFINQAGVSRTMLRRKSEKVA